MRTYEQDAKTPELPWPFTGRADELELVRGALTAGRPIVVTGPAGRGRTPADHGGGPGLDHARVTGTPGARDLPLAAFRPPAPDTVSLHGPGAVGRAALVMDDAQLLDETSPPWSLALSRACLARPHPPGGGLSRRTARPRPGRCPGCGPGSCCPGWPLDPLSPEDTAQLLAGAGLEPLTVAGCTRRAGAICGCCATW